MDLSKFLVALYEASHQTPPEAFQDRALDLLKAALSFESAVWGSGRYLSDGLEWHTVHLHNEPHEIVAAREHIKDQDTISFTLLPHPVTTMSFHAPTTFDGRKYSAVREYAEKFGHQNVMVSSEISQNTGCAYWIALYRSDADRQYTRDDERIASMITPHLREALRINRVLQMERLRSPQLDEGMAIVDRKGATYHTEPAFMELLHCEWPAWDGGMLPSHFWQALLTNDGRYGGKTIAARGISVNDMVFVKVRRRRAIDLLSARERKVAHCVAQGLSHKEIARALGTSPNTVRVQIQAIHDKLGVHNTAQLIAQVNRSE